MNLTSSPVQTERAHATNTAPTHVRWRVVVLLALMAGLTYIGWTYALDFAALVTMASGLAWLLVDADRPIE